MGQARFRCGAKIITARNVDIIHGHGFIVGIENSTHLNLNGAPGKPGFRHRCSTVVIQAGCVLNRTNATADYIGEGYVAAAVYAVLNIDVFIRLIIKPRPGKVNRKLGSPVQVDQRAFPANFYVKIFPHQNSATGAEKVNHVTAKWSGRFFSPAAHGPAYGREVIYPIGQVSFVGDVELFEVSPGWKYPHRCTLGSRTSAGIGDGDGVSSRTESY